MHQLFTCVTRLSQVTLIAVASLGIALMGAENDSLDRFKDALRGDDSTEKKQALAALTGNDDEVLPLMVKALSDRQLRSAAVSALRARTGLTPSPQRGGNPGYPGYPNDDSAGGWNAWLQARENAKLTEADKAKTEQELAELKKQMHQVTADPEAAAAAAAAAEEDKKASERSLFDPPSRSELGKLDRIFFKDGSILTCYILLKRKDLDGEITSIRIMHRNLAGEEVLESHLITRIEEDFR